MEFCSLFVCVLLYYDLPLHWIDVMYPEVLGSFEFLPIRFALERRRSSQKHVLGFLVLFVHGYPRYLFYAYQV